MTLVALRNAKLRWIDADLLFQPKSSDSTLCRQRETIYLAALELEFSWERATSQIIQVNISVIGQVIYIHTSFLLGEFSSEIRDSC